MQENPISIINELESDFLRKSKWLTKKKKNWKGKKKPDNFIHPSKFEGLPEYLIPIEKERIMEKREKKQYKKNIKKFLSSINSKKKEFFTCSECNKNYNDFETHQLFCGTDFEVEILMEGGI